MIISIIAMGCAKEDVAVKICPPSMVLIDDICCNDINNDGWCDEKTEVIATPMVQKVVPEAKFSCKFFSVVPYFECISAQQVNGNLYLNLVTTKNHPGLHRLKKIIFDDLSGCNWEGNLALEFGGMASVPISCTNPAASKFTLIFEWTGLEVDSNTATITALGEIKPYDNSLTAKIIGIFD